MCVSCGREAHSRCRRPRTPPTTQPPDRTKNPASAPETRRPWRGFGQNLLHSAGEEQRPGSCKPGKQQHKSQNDENPGLVPHCDRTPQTRNGNQKHQGLATQQTGLWDRNDHRCGVHFPNAAERSTARNDTASGNAVSTVAVAKEVNEMGACTCWGNSMSTPLARRIRHNPHCVITETG